MEANAVRIELEPESHRFEDFTDDFATWVIFYGPEDGEAEAPS